MPPLSTPPEMPDQCSSGHPPKPTAIRLGDWPASHRWGLLLSLLAIGLGWWPTFSQMWLRWFPAWERFAGYSLMDRLTKGDSYYSHGPLVPMTSLVLCFFIYKRVGLPSANSISASLVGWFLFVGAILLQLASALAGVTFVSGFALLGVLLALTLLWGGWPMLKAYGVPIVILFFMIPLPMDWIAKLNFQLKSIASDQAVWITDSLLGIPCVKDGSYVFLPLGADGLPKTLVVENVCSGLRSLISLTFFASLFALVCRVRGLWRLMMLLLSVPVAVFCNVIRITSMNVVAHYFSVEAAGEESWFHGFSGMMVFGLALVVLMGIEQLIVLAGSKLKRPWVDPRLLGYLDHLPTVSDDPRNDRSAKPVVGVLLVLALVAAVSVQLSRRGPMPNVSQMAAGAVPRQVTIQDRPYRGQDLKLDDLTLTILETNDYLYRRYVPASMADGSGRGFIDFLIIFSPDNRKGTHPPEVCLEGGGDRIVTKANHQVMMSTSTGTKTIPVRELVTQKQNYRLYHLYVYKCGDRYTTDFFTQQATIFANGLLRRNTAGALIRLTVPVVGQDVESARRQAIASAQALLPEMHQRLLTGGQGEQN